MSVFVEQLAAFVSASEQGSFSEAARILARSQSELKADAANLEVKLGVALLKRTRRGVIPTEIGARLLPEAKLILAPRKPASASMSGIAEPAEKRLVVAIDALYPAGALRNLQAAFAQRFPGIALELLFPEMTDVCRLVLDGKVDLGVMWRQEEPPPELGVTTIGRIPLKLVNGKEQSLAQARVDWRELKLYRLRLAAETWWVESHWLIQRILKQDAGWALIPAHILTNSPVAQEHTDPVALDVIWHKQRPTDPATDWLRHRLGTVAPEARPLVAGCL